MEVLFLYWCINFTILWCCKVTYYRHRCLADRQALSGHRKGKGISGPEHQEKGGTGEREYRKELPQEDKGYRDCGWRTGRG